MDVVLQYFKDCPNWRVAGARLVEALSATGHSGVPISYLEVTSAGQAADVRFAGSPTILIDGRDVFADQPGGVGLSCRIYATPDGLAGAPTIAQLVAALSRAE